MQGIAGFVYGSVVYESYREYCARKYDRGRCYLAKWSKVEFGDEIRPISSSHWSKMTASAPG
jgi:hypothetical protein